MKILSFNILSEDYINIQDYPHINPKFLSTSYRLPIIKKLLFTINPDIICLQEVHEKVYTHLKKKFSDYYVSPLAKLNLKADDINKNKSGNIILIKKKLFEKELRNPFYNIYNIRYGYNVLEAVLPGLNIYCVHLIDNNRKK